MPVALLLHDVFAALHKGLIKLLPFGRLALIEELLVARARAAFMVHWFGRGIPIYRLGVLMHIDNIAALRARYERILAQMKADEPKGGPNLLEPLATVIGYAMGVYASPTGTIALLFSKLRDLNLALQIIVGIIWGPVMVLLGFWMSTLAGVVGAAAFPVGLAVLLPKGQFGDPLLRGVYDLLGAVARFVTPFAELVKQLAGPRSGVKNPLLRHILDVLDRVAAVAMLTLGLFAVLVTRIAPALVPIAAQLPALFALGRQVFEMASFAFGDLIALFKGMFTDEKSPLEIFVRTLRRLPKLIRAPIESMKILFLAIAISFKALFAVVKSQWRDWKDKFTAGVKALLAEHPLIRLFKAIKTVKDIKWPEEREATFSRPEPEKPGFFGRLLKEQIDALLKEPKRLWAEGPGTKLKEWDPSWIPDFTLPDLDAIAGAVGKPVFRIWEPAWTTYLTPYPEERKVPDWAKAAVDAAARRPHLFKVPPDELGEIRARDRRIREHLITVIERVLVTKLREHVPALLEVFRTIDEELFADDSERARLRKEDHRRKRREEEKPFPVLALESPSELLPVIRKLRVTVKGGYEPEVRAFRGKLLGALRDLRWAQP